MTDHSNRYPHYHGFRFDNMVVVPSPSSMWDYPFPCPYLDQLCVGNTSWPTAKRGPDPGESFFPNKTHSTRTSNTMENASFGNDSKSVAQTAGDTELGEVKVQVVPTASIATSTPPTSPALPEGIPCGNGGCKTSRSRGEPRPESPWHQLKTIFLVSVIVALVIWVVAYTLLTQYQIL